MMMIMKSIQFHIYILQIENSFDHCVISVDCV